MPYENKPISTKDCFDLATKIGDKIEAAWRQFYIVVLAVSAWSFSPTSDAILKNKLILVFITIAVGVFFICNCIFVVKMYRLISILLDELSLRAQEGAFLDDGNLIKFNHLAVNKMHRMSGIVAIFGHILCFAVILVFIAKPVVF